MAFYTIHPRDVKQIFYQKRAVMLDIREPEDYEEYHFPVAKNYPYEDSECWINALNKRRTYILYCEHGSTSLMAARKLSRHGFEAYTVIGGVEALRTYFYN